jgi:preprotein translocase subunit SecY
MFANIVNTLANCFKIPELKSRIIFTLVVLAICRVVAIIPIPGLDGAALTRYAQRNAAKSEGLLGMYSLFTGGALERCAIGALGIMPYISATIIIQLLSAVIPTLSKLAREEGGRTKIVQYGRYLTVLLCLGQGLAMALGWEHPDRIFRYFEGRLVLVENFWWYRIQTVLILTTGTLLLMWLGEQITERGVGNGISLVITIGILARFPQTSRSLYYIFFRRPGGKELLFHGVALLLLLLAVIAAAACDSGSTKIPVQYAQRSVGGRSCQVEARSCLCASITRSNADHIRSGDFDVPGRTVPELWEAPWSSILKSIADRSSRGSFTYVCLEALMIIFFSYFWVATQFTELQISDDLKKYGGYIWVWPGQATSQFLHQAMSRITLAGAIFLAAIAIFPVLLYETLKVPFDVASFFGGTSILITVGVMLDTMRQMEFHLLMRHYDGFLKKGRVRGRF